MNFPTLVKTDAPVDSYGKSKLPALEFTRQIIDNNPDAYTNVNAQALDYAMFAGLEYDQHMVLESIKNWFKCNAEGADVTSFIVRYAKLMAESESIINFEPIYDLTVKVMQAWKLNDVVEYNGKDYSSAMFKPVCYNCAGESIYELVPYIALVACLLTASAPFKFMSTYYEAQGFTFLTMLDNHLMKGYQGLAKDLGINIASRGLSALSDIDNKYFRDLFNVVLNPKTIIVLRNDYMKQAEGLLDTCIERQQSITRDGLTGAYRNIINEMFKMFIHESFLVRLINVFPKWSSEQSIGSHELALWTEYALAGGDKPLAITKDNINMYCDDVKHDLSKTFVGDRKLMANGIASITNSIPGQPFSANDIVLRMVSSHVKNEFENLQNDIFEGDAFNFDEAILDARFHDIARAITNIYIHGRLAQSSTSFNEMFKLLLKVSHTFIVELADINSLSTLAYELFDNKIAAASINALILSLIEDWVVEKCANFESLKSFSIYKALAKVELKKHVGTINKLADMVVSFTTLCNEAYSKFVNNTVSDFMAEIVAAKGLFISFVKGMEDQAEAYAIGGCELYNQAKISNPLVRAIHWYTSVYGMNESVYSILRYVENFSNGSLLELMEAYKSNPTEMNSLLKIHVGKMFEEKCMPMMLNSFTFDDTTGIYKYRDPAYITNIDFITKLCKHIFMKSSPSQTTTKSLMFVPINASNISKVTVGKKTKNNITVDGKDYPVTLDETSNSVYLPVYDYTGAKSHVNISFITPANCRCLWLNMFGNKSNDNNTVLLVTDTPIKTRFQTYEFDDTAKPRLTKLQNAAHIKQQGEMIKPTLQSAKYLAEQNIN